MISRLRCKYVFNTSIQRTHGRSRLLLNTSNHRGRLETVDFSIWTFLFAEFWKYKLFNVLWEVCATICIFIYRQLQSYAALHSFLRTSDLEWCKMLPCINFGRIWRKSDSKKVGCVFPITSLNKSFGCCNSVVAFNLVPLTANWSNLCVIRLHKFNRFYELTCSHPFSFRS